MKPKLYVVPCTIAVLLVALVGCSIFKSDVDKAREFIQASMYPQAIALLTKKIEEKPTNAEAHFLLGVCFINTGKPADGEEEFRKAVGFKSDYGRDIGKEFLKAAKTSLSKKSAIPLTQHLFSKAIEYEPNTRQSVAKELFTEGKNFAASAHYEDLDIRFMIASSIDGSLKNEICSVYYGLGNSATGKESFWFYRRAQQYCQSYNQEIGQRLLVMAKNVPSKEESDQYVQEASKYVSKAAIFDKLAQTFTLTKGSKQNTISIPNNKTAIFSSNKDFYIVKRTGNKPDGSEILNRIKTPAGTTRKFFQWGGTVVVEGIYDGTELKITYE